VRVLHVITGLDAGGAEHQLRLLLRHLPVRCEVATLTNPGLVAAAIRADGTPVFHLGMRHNRDASVLPRLAGLMRRRRYDLVHTHLYRACVYGAVAARLAGVPHLVATEHSLGPTMIEGRPVSPGVRRLYLAAQRRADATIAVSAAVADRLAGWGVPAGRITVIPNGIEAARFRYDPRQRAAYRARLGLRDGDPVVGAVARLEPPKQLAELVRAVAGLDGVTLLLVGAGSQRAELAALADAAGIAGRVRFAGGTGQVHPALCAMDVLASPSPAETFGVAVLEALACGLPVVYASCPAVEELPAGDAPGARRVPAGAQAMREALRGILATPAPADRTPPPAVSRYDIGSAAARVARLYQQVRAARWQPDRPTNRPAAPRPGPAGQGPRPGTRPPPGPAPAGVIPTEES
jgi:glycosyltransferase involved in cell wall biosynthesis